jgi:hypothetical protein
MKPFLALETLNMNQTLDPLIEKLAIHDVVQSWALYRDTGDWEGLRSTVHDNAHMTATWFDGSFKDFILAVEQSWRKGSSSQHCLGGTVSAIRGCKAIAQTRMSIMVRGQIEGLEVDITCTGRFYDRVEKRGEHWKILKRNVIYEKDRLDLVDPSATLKLDTLRLNQFPQGYQHLAYLQSLHGANVSTQLATSRGPALDQLISEAQAWLNS